MTTIHFEVDWFPWSRFLRLIDVNHSAEPAPVAFSASFDSTLSLTMPRPESNQRTRSRKPHAKHETSLRVSPLRNRNDGAREAGGGDTV